MPVVSPLCIRNLKMVKTQKFASSPGRTELRDRIPGLLFSLLGCLALVSCASAAGEISASWGDTIALEGYSYGSPAVYLFITGQNLPVNGVSLQDSSARADEGHFTRVPVDSNDHWIYTWRTGVSAGHLDTGTYTVWVVTKPQDRSRLGDADYSTISVRLKRPSIRLDLPVTSGAVTLHSVPGGAHGEVERVCPGRTPLAISFRGLKTCLVTFSKAGFLSVHTNKDGTGENNRINCSTPSGNRITRHHHTSLQSQYPARLRISGYFAIYPFIPQSGERYAHCLTRGLYDN